MRTAIGVVEVTSIDEIGAPLDDAEARRSGADSVADVQRWLDERGDGRIFRIGLRYAGADSRVDLRQNDAISEEELTEVIRSLDRLDRASARGPWTREVLALIQAQPEIRAEIWWPSSVANDFFKRDVRKLKELGLTESLAVGYRLSPRGRVVVLRL